MPFHVLIEQRKKITHSTVAGFEIVDENEREVTRRVQSTNTIRYREKIRNNSLFTLSFVGLFGLFN